MLTNLTQLNFRYNQLAIIPESIGELKNLEVLILANNQFTSLPSSISNLTNLKELILKNNPIIHPPYNVAIQGIESIREWFKGHHSNNLKRSRKILVVGDAESGKTSLVLRLTESEMKWKEIQRITKERTEGVDVYGVEVNDSYWRIWDFAGQEIYFGSHRLYFTSDSLYVIVFKLNVDNNKVIQAIKKWTLSIQQQSSQSEMLLAGTYLDNIKVHDSLTDYIEYNTNLKDIVFISNKNSTNIDQVRQRILNSTQTDNVK